MNETLDTMSPLMQSRTPVSNMPLDDVPRPFMVLLIVGTILMACIAWPVRVPLFLAAVLTVVTRPIYYRMTLWLGGRPRMAGAVMTLLLLACIVVPVISLGAGAFRELTDGFAWLRDRLGFAHEEQAATPELIKRAMEKAGNILHLSREELQGYVGEAMRAAQRAAPYIVTASVSAFGKAFLLLISFYFLTVDGHWLTSFIGRTSPLRPAETHEILGEFRNVTSAAVLGNAVNALLQACVLYAGFHVTHIPHALFFGILAVPAALVPLVGSQLIWAPAMGILLFQGRVAAGVGLAAWCTIMVLIVDNVVKPWVLRGKVEFHGGLLLLGFIGGLALFGLPGLVAGPLVVSFSLTLFRIYQRDYLNRSIVTQSAP